MAHTIEIFRAGRHTANSGETLDFSADALAAAAAGYDPTLHEAPIVIGHPANDAPAYGWVRGLRLDGDRVVAELEQLDEQFAELVKAGKFKKRSAAWYTPDAPGNPTPGVWYLRHVAFLGAQPPAVKGLKDVRFEANETGVETVEMAEPRATPSDPPPETPTMADNANTPASADRPDLTARQAELDARAAELEARETALAASEARAQRRELAAFAEQLIEQGRLLPRHKARITELLFAVGDEAGQTLEFAEGDQQVKATPRQLLREFLAELPVRVDYAERSAPSGDDANDLPGYQPPPGYQADPKRARLHRDALAYAEQHNVAYDQAVTILERRQ